MPLNPYSSIIYQRSLACFLLIGNTALCNECYLLVQKTRQEKTRKHKFREAAKLKAPITKTAPKRVLTTLQKQRLNCKQFEKEIRKMNKEFQQNNVNVDNTLTNDFMNMLFESSSKVSPFMNLFWQQQTKLFKFQKRSALDSVCFWPQSLSLVTRSFVIAIY